MDNKFHILPLSQTGQRTGETASRLYHCKTDQNSGLTHNLFVLFATVVFFILTATPSKGQPMADPDPPHHGVAETTLCDNYIKIDGSTNVNHFHFIQEIKSEKEIIKRPDNHSETLVLKIPAHDFEPSNPMMYKDFLEFIKANEYPDIEITIFLNTTRLPAGPDNTIAPRIKIGLAGKNHIYKIPGEIKECRDKNLHITGRVNIDLEDFGLEPPTKFMGMIKVSNEVFINFGLTINN